MTTVENTDVLILVHNGTKERPQPNSLLVAHHVKKKDTFKWYVRCIVDEDPLYVTDWAEKTYEDICYYEKYYKARRITAVQVGNGVLDP